MKGVITLSLLALLADHAGAQDGPQFVRFFIENKEVQKHVCPDEGRLTKVRAALVPALKTGKPAEADGALKNFHADELSRLRRTYVHAYLPFSLLESAAAEEIGLVGEQQRLFATVIHASIANVSDALMPKANSDAVLSAFLAENEKALHAALEALCLDVKVALTPDQSGAFANKILSSPNLHGRLAVHTFGKHAAQRIKSIRRFNIQLHSHDRYSLINVLHSKKARQVCGIPDQFLQTLSSDTLKRITPDRPEETFRSKPTPEIRTSMGDRIRQLDAHAKSILARLDTDAGAGTARRFTELRNQLLGPGAIMSRDIQKRYGVTAQQSETLLKSIKELSLRTDQNPVDFPVNLSRTILGCLTETQRTHWKTDCGPLLTEPDLATIRREIDQHLAQYQKSH
jgi:hypothetical protein